VSAARQISRPMDATAIELPRQLRRIRELGSFRKMDERDTANDTRLCSVRRIGIT
jgi:hypothetical protein